MRPYYRLTTMRMFSVREATPADIPALIELMREFYAESAYELDGRTAALAFQALLTAPERGKVWLALAEHSPAGHIVLSLRFAMEHEGLIGHIDDLFVKPELRRLGIGRRLVAELRRYCQSAGCRALHVEVGDSNRAALALYEQFGLHVLRDGRVLASGPLSAEII